MSRSKHICSPHDKVYAEIGRNWIGLADFAKQYGFMMDTVVFVKNDSEIRLTIAQLQSPNCIEFLRTAMVGVRKANSMKGKES